METIKSWEIHWKAPIQPKGFLKIIEMVLALLAFALVAGFTATNHASCAGWNNTAKILPATIESNSRYPFNELMVAIDIADPNDTHVLPLEFSYNLGASYQQSSQFFVAWGVLTIFYGIISLLVYILTTANSKLEWFVNYLVLAVSL
jgi:hypothetical protein